MMARRLVGLLMIVSSIVAVPAPAAVYLATFGGTTGVSWDFTGEFGGNGSLAGLPFTATFRLTVPTPGAITSNDGTSATIRGGTENDPDVPTPVSGSATVNGVTRNIAGLYRGLATRTNGFTGPGTGSDVLEFQVSDDHEQGYFSATRYMLIRLESSSRNLFDDVDPGSPLFYERQPGDLTYGNIALEDMNYDPNSSGPTDVNASIGFLVDRMTIAVEPEAVPEPATWATFIAGFGLIGAGMRRQRRTDDLSI